MEDPFAPPERKRNPLVLVGMSASCKRTNEQCKTQFISFPHAAIGCTSRSASHCRSLDGWAGRVQTGDLKICVVLLKPMPFREVTICRLSSVVDAGKEQLVSSHDASASGDTGVELSPGGIPRPLVRRVSIGL